MVRDLLPVIKNNITRKLNQASQHITIEHKNGYIHCKSQGIRQLASYRHLKTDNLTIKAFKYPKLTWHITHLSRDSINGLSTDARQTIKSTNIISQIVSNLYTVSTPSRLSISSNQQLHKISYKWVKRVFTKSKELIARQDIQHFTSTELSEMIFSQISFNFSN